MKFVRTCIAVAAWAPMFAMAAIGPGQWSLGGLAQICLQSNGSWYGTSFSPWGGHWKVGPKNVHIYGNYSSGAGNDSIVSNKKLTRANWTEWNDGLSFELVTEQFAITFVKAACDPPTNAVEGQKANPLQQ